MTVQSRIHPDFQDDLVHLLNKHNFDTLTNTEDYTLAAMLTEMLEAYRKARKWQMTEIAHDTR